MKLNIDFYHSGVKKAFGKFKKQLIEKGFTEKEANELLESIYSAVCEEYGN